MHLSYSDTIEILARLNEISTESMGAFKARLRHFQRLGFPEGSNTGKGKPARYDLSMVLQLALATQFIQAGLPPAKIAQMIKHNWPATISHMFIALVPQGRLKDNTGRVVDVDISLCASPESLRELSTFGDSEEDYYDAFYFEPTARLGDLFNDPDFHPHLGAYFRWIVINLRPLMHFVLIHLKNVCDIAFNDTSDELERILAERESDVIRTAALIKAQLDKNRDGDT